MVWIILLLILILLMVVVVVVVVVAVAILMLMIVAIPIPTVYLFNPLSISWVSRRSRVCADLVFAMAAFGFVEEVDSEEQGL